MHIVVVIIGALLPGLRYRSQTRVAESHFVFCVCALFQANYGHLSITAPKKFIYLYTCIALYI